MQLQVHATFVRYDPFCLTFNLHCTDLADLTAAELMAVLAPVLPAIRRHLDAGGMIKDTSSVGWVRGLRPPVLWYGWELAYPFW